MFTRQSRVFIDFDDAYREWNANKQKLENGSYKYICCGLLTTTGKMCKNEPLIGSNYCAIHQKKIRSKL